MYGRSIFIAFLSFQPGPSEHQESGRGGPCDDHADKCFHLGLMQKNFSTSSRPRLISDAKALSVVILS